MKDLGTRMKKYEAAYQFRLTPRVPVIIRLDGKAFHTLTRCCCDKPFDISFMNSMRLAAQKVCEEIQGFQLAYVQSDEVSILLSDYAKIDTQGWFDNKLSKIVSIAASMMSVYFTQQLADYPKFVDKVGIFDSRAFNVPKDDVSNYFLWRVKDWQRNSLSMYAQYFFSHKQLKNKHASDVHNMLHCIGKNWAKDVDKMCKNGTWILPDKKITCRGFTTYQEIEKLWRNKDDS